MSLISIRSTLLSLYLRIYPDCVAAFAAPYSLHTRLQDDPPAFIVKELVQTNSACNHIVSCHSRSQVHSHSRPTRRISTNSIAASCTTINFELILKHAPKRRSRLRKAPRIRGRLNLTTTRRSVHNCPNYQLQLRKYHTLENERHKNNLLNKNHEKGTCGSDVGNQK